MQCNMTTFLYIEGVFNNVNAIVIQKALFDPDVEKYINEWLVSMLKTNIVTVDHGNRKGSGKKNIAGRSYLTAVMACCC